MDDIILTPTFTSGLGLEADTTVITKITDYVKKFPEMTDLVLFPTENFHGDPEESLEQRECTSQGEKILKILTTDITIYILRRMPHVCASHIDNMGSIKRKLIRDYEKLYPTYKDPNSEVDF